MTITGPNRPLNSSAPRARSASSPSIQKALDAYQGSVYFDIDTRIAAATARQKVAFTVAGLGAAGMLGGMLAAASNPSAGAGVLLGGLATAVVGAGWAMGEGQHICSLSMMGMEQASTDLLMSSLRPL